MVKPGSALLCRTILCLCLLEAYPSPAADIAYQGTHILTHGAFQELATAFEKKPENRVSPSIRHSAPPVNVPSTG
ncbi:MAG: hypothetical protein ACYC9Y_00800 [Candidatus Methylomirabilia bacterium]